MNGKVLTALENVEMDDNRLNARWWDLRDRAKQLNQQFWSWRVREL